MKKLLILFICLVISGCVTSAPRPHLVAFDEVDFLPYAGTGTGKIIGQAFLKTRGGDVKYGAGNEVMLVPNTPYTSEIIDAMVDNVLMEVPDRRYRKYRRTTRADGQGNFEFNNLPDGEYLVGCNIQWEVGGKHTRVTGAYAYTRVSIEDGKAVKIILTR